MHKNLKWNIEIYVQNKLSSDHLPVTTALKLKRMEMEEIVKTVDWDKFRSIINIGNKQITTKEDIQKKAITIQTEIKNAMKTATVIKTRKETDKLLQHIKEAIKAKNHIKMLKKEHYTLYTKLNSTSEQMK